MKELDYGVVCQSDGKNSLICMIVIIAPTSTLGKERVGITKKYNMGSAVKTLSLLKILKRSIKG